MPTYDYRCDHCGHEFSRIQSFKEGALEVCPNCGQRPTRLMSLPSIVFKGSGWYKTDSRRGGSSSESSSGASAKTDTAGKADKAEKKADAPKTDKPAGSGGGSTGSSGSSGAGG